MDSFTNFCLTLNPKDSLLRSPVDDVYNEASWNDLVKRMDEMETKQRKQAIEISARNIEITSLKLELEENAKKIEALLKETKELRERCNKLEKDNAVQDELKKSGTPRNYWKILIAAALLSGICVGEEGFCVAYLIGASGIAQFSITGVSVGVGSVVGGGLGHVLTK